jgi:hypothetical protein
VCCGIGEEVLDKKHEGTAWYVHSHLEGSKTSVIGRCVGVRSCPDGNRRRSGAGFSSLGAAVTNDAAQVMVPQRMNGCELAVTVHLPEAQLINLM